MSFFVPGSLSRICREELPHSVNEFFCISAFALPSVCLTSTGKRVRLVSQLVLLFALGLFPLIPSYVLFNNVEFETILNCYYLSFSVLLCVALEERYLSRHDCVCVHWFLFCMGSNGLFSASALQQCACTLSVHGGVCVHGKALVLFHYAMIFFLCSDEAEEKEVVKAPVSKKVCNDSKRKALHVYACVDCECARQGDDTLCLWRP